jgi:hypothetical protein
MSDRHCSVCGRPLDGRRKGAKTCEGKCRTAAWRARKAMPTPETGIEACSESVTVTDVPVTLRELLGGPCPNPNRCRYFMRHPTGPWTCEHNHPREPAQPAARGLAR